MGLPARSMSSARARASIAATAEPTVPKPARPTLRGAFINADPGLRAASAPRGERDDVVQLFRTGFKETADVARGLADALLVFHERDADKTFAVFTEADAGRHRHFRLLH